MPYTRLSSIQNYKEYEASINIIDSFTTNTDTFCNLTYSKRRCLNCYPDGWAADTTITNTLITNRLVILLVSIRLLEKLKSGTPFPLLFLEILRRSISL